MISVLVADDHPVVRDGLCTMLELEPDIKVVGQGRPTVPRLWSRRAGPTPT